MLKPGDNPRRLLVGHVERGPVAHVFTLRQIAEAAGVRDQTVRAAISRKQLDIASLSSVAMFVVRNIGAKQKPLSDEQARASLPPRQARWWDARWPAFDLYRCPVDGCTELRLEPGPCRHHGGVRPMLKFDSDWTPYMSVADGYIPIHRLISQPPGGLQNHHRDGNVWNNRWANTEHLTPEEHQDRHVGGILTADVVADQPTRRLLQREHRGMSRSELQQVKDRFYTLGIEEGRRRFERRK